MPVNKAYPAREAPPGGARPSPRRHGRMVTLEFILIDDVNDSLDQARRLRDIALDLHAHVNLIPYNTVEGLPWKRPSGVRQLAFAEILGPRGRVGHAPAREGPRHRGGVRAVAAQDGARARGAGRRRSFILKDIGNYRSYVRF